MRTTHSRLLGALISLSPIVTALPQAAAPVILQRATSVVGGQAIDFSKVDAAGPAVITAVPFLGTANSPTIQPAAAVVNIASSAVADSPTASGLSVVPRSLLGQRKVTLAENAARKVVKRDGDCSTQPAGTGPTVSPDTTTAFLAYEPFALESENACTPDGYTKAFTNLQGSTQTTSYLGYTTLNSYDTDDCAAFCNAVDACQGFDIYFERDPSLDPNSVTCPNPAGLTNIKCAIWGVQVSDTTADNVGQWRADFEVVITGSNGYNRDAPPPSEPGYVGPVHLGGAYSAPLDPVTNTDTYITYQYFPFGTDSSSGQIQYYNPEVCTAACTATTDFDTQNKLGVDGQGAPARCNMVVAYVLSDADVPQGVYCAMYTESWDPVYATNIGQFRPNSAGGSDFWAVSQAYAYINGTYAAEFPEICATGGCASGSFQGGSCGGWGTGTC